MSFHCCHPGPVTQKCLIMMGLQVECSGFLHTGWSSPADEDAPQVHHHLIITLQRVAMRRRGLFSLDLS